MLQSHRQALLPGRSVSLFSEGTPGGGERGLQGEELVGCQQHRLEHMAAVGPDGLAEEGIIASQGRAHRLPGDLFTARASNSFGADRVIQFSDKDLTRKRERSENAKG
jgi:hypothetical protein